MMNEEQINNIEAQLLFLCEKIEIIEKNIHGICEELKLINYKLGHVHG